MASSSRLRGEVVDEVIVGDHALGEGHVLTVERRRRLVDRVGDEVRDADESLLHLVELLLEDLAHVSPLCGRAGDHRPGPR